MQVGTARILKVGEIPYFVKVWKDSTTVSIAWVNHYETSSKTGGGGEP